MKKNNENLFLEKKLPNDPTEGQPEITLFQQAFPQKGYAFSMMPVNLAKHIGIMHRWANLPYSARFWQMDGTETQLYNFYLQKLRGPDYRIFIIFMDDIPIAQLEVYQAIKDEVSEHFRPVQDDLGLHLLMAPYREILDSGKKGLSKLSLDVLQTCLLFLFSFPSVSRVIAEPDSENVAACNLALEAGFRFEKKINMSYKTANLYFCDRLHFQSVMTAVKCCSPDLEQQNLRHQ